MVRGSSSYGHFFDGVFPRLTPNYIAIYTLEGGATYLVVGLIVSLVIALIWRLLRPRTEQLSDSKWWRI